MRKTILSFISTCLLAASLAAFAQSGDNMKQDSMKHPSLTKGGARGKYHREKVLTSAEGELGVKGAMPFQPFRTLDPAYISSSMRECARSCGICKVAFTRGPLFNTGSALCNAGRSIRSKNLPIGISSPHTRDCCIAPIQFVGSYAGLSSSFFTRERNHWYVLSWL